MQLLLILIYIFVMFLALSLYYCSQTNCRENPSVQNVIIAIVSKADVIGGSLLIWTQRNVRWWIGVCYTAGHLPVMCKTLLRVAYLSICLHKWVRVCIQYVCDCVFGQVVCVSFEKWMKEGHVLKNISFLKIKRRKSQVRTKWFLS